MAERLPLPDPSAFDTGFFVEKHHDLNFSKQCPSPPVKSPPVSRTHDHRASHLRATSLSPASHRSATKTPSPFLAGSGYHVDRDPMEYPGFQRRFETCDRIGTGTMSEVYRVKSKADGRLYAVKVPKSRFRLERLRQKAVEVAKDVMKLNSDRCVRYYDYWEERDPGVRNSSMFVCVQMELCDHGSLRQRMNEVAEMDEEEIWEVLLDILQGLDVIHSAKQVHLDINPDNIFLDSNDVAKIGDFGISTRSNERIENEGTPRYMSAEMLDKDTKSDWSADIFSLGATTLEMASNIDMPSSGPAWRRLRNGQLPVDRMRAHGRSPALQQVIADMMHPTPSHRPTARQLLSHPILARRAAARTASGLHATILRATTRIQLRCDVGLCALREWWRPTPVEHGASSPAPSPPRPRRPGPEETPSFSPAPGARTPGGAGGRAGGGGGGHMGGFSPTIGGRLDESGMASEADTSSEHVLERLQSPMRLDFDALDGGLRVEYPPPEGAERKKGPQWQWAVIAVFILLGVLARTVGLSRVAWVMMRSPLTYAVLLMLVLGVLVWLAAPRPSRNSRQS